MLPNKERKGSNWLQKKRCKSAKSTQTVQIGQRRNSFFFILILISKFVIQLFCISRFHYVRMVVPALIFLNMRIHISRVRCVECVGRKHVKQTNEESVRFVNCMYGAKSFRSKPSERMWRNVCCFSIHFNKTVRETLKTCYGNVSNWK